MLGKKYKILDNNYEKNYFTNAQLNSVCYDEDFRNVVKLTKEYCIKAFIDEYNEELSDDDINSFKKTLDSCLKEDFEYTTTNLHNNDQPVKLFSIDIGNTTHDIYLVCFQLTYY